MHLFKSNQLTYDYVAMNNYFDLLMSRKSAESIRVITNLGILQDVKTQGGIPAWNLKASFKRNLYSSVFGDQVG